MNLIRRPQFILDVEEAADYLFTEAGRDVALHWREALKSTVKILRQFPEIGRLRSDLPMPGVRAFYVKGFARWLVFYRIEAGQIELLRVKHGMMHLPGLFESSCR